ncbi:Peroxiredoxin [Bernardetia litoralis DSM 6794]|uniref:Peroxiredoxin n=1 Tax=Bernardetia litoralis (strain ATCC 23117 / DSM 6794 / NBRC 15988 / NCIMB 1366 / Fx l1 / Sio-4) TaxID=880071 RepID=I4AGC6_BERLS|nr:redoxin domain-containing protein [Bernardetia litoralis]AFM03011.1 Peroxiredoxin [Bernardetia litoralis DSM 6794]
MRLKTGQSAPLFSLTDIYDREIDLSSYKNKNKKILISFFRNVACPFCNFRVHQLTKKNEKWKDKLEMIFFLESKKDVILRSIFHQEVSPIPIISDENKVMYQKYGIEKSAFKMFGTFISSKNRTTFNTAKKMGLDIDSGEKPVLTIPADFLLDENLNIIEAYYGSNTADNLPFERIEEAIFGKK